MTYLSIRHCKYALLNILQSSTLTPLAFFKQVRYDAICILHSLSWSSGKEPRSGGMGLAKLVPPPGEPNDIAGLEKVWK